ncbi:MAG: SDR family NAD(P)-dependent oxidoreductase [Myxococcota bacterium]|nr:SDR family NAD(P)-dependent oxidoreductase [Myxococcota bacterium]
MKPSVLVTGASQGIGAATAQLLADRGFRVFGTSRDSAAAPGTAAQVEWVALDVRDENSVVRCVAEVLAACEHLDGLVCNAGYGIFGSVEEVSLSQAVDQFETNFFGVLRTLRAVLPGMRRARRGRIVLVGSLAGRAPIPFQAHYSASKAATEALALALHGELHAFGIPVSLVEPGDIDTGFNAAMDWGDPAASAYAPQASAVERVIRDALPRAPGPEAVAQVIHRALTARRPRVRYTVGAGSGQVPWARRLLPDRLSLRLLRSHFGL